METDTTARCTDANQDEYIQKCECDTFWIIEEAGGIFSKQELVNWWIPSSLKAVSLADVLELIEDEFGEADVFTLTRTSDQLFDPTPRRGGFAVVGKNIVFTNCLKLIQERDVIKYRDEIAREESEKREQNRQKREDANRRWNDLWVKAGRASDED